MIKKPIPYGHQYITDEDAAAVIDALKANYITQGPRVEEFEHKFAEYIGVNHATAVSNGTAALHLSALALGVKPGDKVLVVTMTFVASANCIRYCGADVTFCDIDKDSYLIDLDKLRKTLEAAPKGTYKGIVAVDFAGYPVDLEKLSALAKEFNLWVIEDACHAPGGYFVDSKGIKQYCGNGKFADLTVFSFHPVKHIATGEGGMITTNKDDLYDQVSRLRSHGITKDPAIMSKNDGGWYYEMIELGCNYRMTEFQAALGLSQLKRAEWGLTRRYEIVDKYNKAFAHIEGITTPKVADNCYHAYHLYIIQVEDRKGLYDFLREKEILSQIHYIPVHVQPYYKQLGSKEGDCPVAEDYYKHCISLPLFPILTDEQQAYVIEQVKTFLKASH